LQIWKCPPEKEEPLPKDLKKGDPCVFNIKDFRMEVGGCVGVGVWVGVWVCGWGCGWGCECECGCG
jgi:hypothetical protein